MSEQQIVDEVLRSLPRNTRFVESIQTSVSCTYLEAVAAIVHAYAPVSSRRPLGLLTMCAVAAIAVATGRGNRLIDDARRAGRKPHPAIVAAEMLGRRIHWRAA